MIWWVSVAQPPSIFQITYALLVLVRSQVSKDLLSSSQSNVFADMVRDIVRQVKLNPNQIPVPSTYRRSGIDKVILEF